MTLPGSGRYAAFSAVQKKELDFFSELACVGWGVEDRWGTWSLWSKDLGKISSVAMKKLKKSGKAGFSRWGTGVEQARTVQ